MTHWQEVVADVPDFAGRIRALFDSGTNKTIATLRFDGSPRISGTELRFDDGRVILGMMPDSRKLADVVRDPRVAIHSPTLEPPEESVLWKGEAKLAGTLVAIAAPTDGPSGSYFELDITEVVLTRLHESAALLVIESWHPGRGYRVLERE